MAAIGPRLPSWRDAKGWQHACQLGAEGIVSKKIDSTYRSGPCRVWIKVRNPASIVVQRERSENWNNSPPGANLERLNGRSQTR
jgi:hypothetical protein